MDLDTKMPGEATEGTVKVPVEDVALRAQPRPVTRLNRRVLIVLFGGLAAAVLLAMLWSLRSTQRGSAAEPTELYNVDRVSRSEGLEQLPADYSQLPPELPAEIPELGPPLPGDLGGPILKAEQEAQGSGDPAAGNNPAEAERLARLKEAEEAVASSVFFRSSGQVSIAAVPTQVASGLAASAAINPLAAGIVPVAPGDSADAQNGQDQKEAFGSKSASTEIRNSGNMKMPASPYQVMAGTVIAAALITGIQSDLPGDVIGTVTESVYDTATGNHLLIPQGSRLLGKYNSQVSYGQSRVQVVWNRVILPDTSSFQLDNLVGSDPAGYAGLEDGVDWHWGRLFAGAAMSTLLGIGAELVAPESRSDGDRLIVAGGDSLQDTMNQVGQEMSRRNLNLQPTLSIRPGMPLRILVNRDLMLRPYEPLFFQRGASR